MSAETDNPVAIVGAGLAGLAAAVTLREAGRSVVVLEAADGVGGRVRTDVHEGDHGRYLIDRGFQVYLDRYPEGRRFFDHAALGLRAFEPGAVVFADGRSRRIADPRRRPQDLIATAFSGIAKVSDLRAMLRLESMLRSGNPFKHEERPAIDMLREAGLSDRVIDRFFRPFFGGVFFDRGLRTSGRMLAFTYSMFAEGRACLPEGGMQRLPEQLAAKLPRGSVRLNEPVDRVSEHAVTLGSGAQIDAAAVIVATDADAAARFVPDADLGEADGWGSTVTLAFDAPKLARPGAWLMLDGDGAGPVNHLAVPSAVQPGYAPAGRSLVYANTSGDPGIRGAELEEAVRKQLSAWFGPAAASWTLLAEVSVPCALPRRDGWLLDPHTLAVRSPGGVYICGDHARDPSINGALASGRVAAEAVIGHG